MKFLISLILFSGVLFANQEAIFIKNQGQVDSDVLYYAQFKGLNVFMKQDGFYYDFYQEIDKNDKKVSRKGHIVKLDFINSNVSTFKTKENITKYNFMKGRDKSSWITNVETTKEITLDNIYDNIDMKMYFDNDIPRYDLILAPNADPSQIKFQFKSAYNTEVEDDLIKGYLNIGDFYSNKLFAYQMIDGNRVKVECSFVSNGDGTVKFDLGNYDSTKELVIDPIIYSSLLGWNGDDYVAQVKASSNTSYAVAGVTESPDFITTEGAYQAEFGLEKDIFISKYNLVGATHILTHATFFGGGEDDIVKKMIVEEDGKVYFCGNTKSDDFPLKGELGKFYGGNQDGYVVVLKSDLSDVVYSYYVGGNEEDGLNDISVKSNKVFFGGYTKSANMTTQSAFQKELKGTKDGILGATRTNGSSFEFLTYFGGGLEDEINGIDIDSREYVYFIATTNSGDFRLEPSGGDNRRRNSPVDDSYNGNMDIAVGRFTATCGQLELSTYIGGSGNDYGIDVFEQNGKEYYFIGSSEKEATQTLPVMEGLYQTQNNGESDLVFGRVSDLLSKTVRIGWSNVTYKTQDLEIFTFIGGKGNDIGLEAVRSPDKQSFLIGGYTTSTDFPAINNELKKIRYSGKNDGFFLEINSQGSSVTRSSFIGGKDDEQINSVDFFPNGNFIFGGETISDDFYNVGFKNNSTRLNKDGFIATSAKGSFILTAPNNAESFCPGIPINTTWSKLDFEEGDGFNVYLINDKLNTKELLKEKQKGNLYSWIVPQDVVADSNYRILVDHAEGYYAISANKLIINQTPKINSFDISTDKLCVGDSVTLTATSSGVYYPKYNWKFKNEIVTVTSQNSLVIKDLTVESTGAYSLELIGECNPTAKSESKDLDVAPMTAINEIASNNITVKKGEKLEIEVKAEGAELSYQWMLNGSNLNGQTNAKLVIASADVADEGEYTCKVNGRCGDEVTSEPISVEVEVGGMSVTNSNLFDSFHFDGQNINAEFKVNQNGLALSKIVDLQGKEVYNDNIFLSQGTNKLIIPANFENGTYLFSIIVNQKVISYKFAVIK